MSIFDNLIGSVVTAVAGEKAPALKDFLQESGGVSGLYTKFQNGGLGQVFGSWVSTGENQLISPQQIEAVMGNAQVQAFAKMVGIDPAKASEFLATTLPQLIDQLTPDGEVPVDAATVATGTAAAAAETTLPSAPTA